jgi:hypothetical protein
MNMRPPATLTPAALVGISLIAANALVPQIRNSVRLADSPAAPAALISLDDSLVLIAITPLPQDAFFTHFSRVQHHRAAIRAVTFTAISTTEQWNAARGQWQFLDRYEGAILIDATQPRAAKASVIRHTHVDPLTGQTTTESFIESYAPGQRWEDQAIRRLYTPPHSLSKAVHKPGGYFQSASLLARDFSLPLMWSDGAGFEITMPLFGDLLLSFSGVAIDVREVDCDLGHHLLDFTTSSAFADREIRHVTHWLFDPARAYTLLAVYSTQNDRLFNQHVVDELAEPAPGVFFPTKAHTLTSYPDQPPTRTAFSATNIILNPPTTPTDFQLPPNLTYTRLPPEQTNRQ